jgi:hypothetical protein
MVEIGSPEIQDFLQRLGARYPGTGTLYLLGGSALIQPPLSAIARAPSCNPERTAMTIRRSI